MPFAYQYEVTSVHALVQQLASNLLPHGYWFYVTGFIPEPKPVEVTDRKLLDKYGIAISPSARQRRKAAGFANLRYLRCGRFLVLIATHGKHDFFAEEGERIRDIRRNPLIWEGYSVSYKRGGHLRKVRDGEAVPDPNWHSRVQIAKKNYTELKAHFLDLALRRSVEALGREFYALPYEPFAPIRQQLLDLLRLVNAKRKTAGLPNVPPTVLRYERDGSARLKPPETQRAA
ncbi:MAG: hypothetical protein U0746_03110 [Gemmataceae bacterium]